MNIKLLDERATLPTKGSEYSAGFDLYCLADYTIFPHTTMKVSTGIAVEIPVDYCGLVFARSGLATKQGLRPANCVGLIDADYRGEIIVALHNDGEKPQEIKAGDRIAQLVITPYLNTTLNVVDTLSDTDRGSGGFGSTGA